MRELLDAFFTSPHAPTAALPWQVTSEAVCRPTTYDGSFWYRVIVSTDTADAEVAHWRHIMFGGDAYASSTGLPPGQRTTVMVTRHDALTRAALPVVHRWLQPAEALGVALQCLARSHARCAEQWTAVLERQPTDGKGSSATADHCCQNDGSAETAITPDSLPCLRSLIASACPATAAAPAEGAVDAVPAAVVQLMVDQHRAYGALLSTPEQLEWIDVTLRCTQCGSERQRVIKAAFMTRWHCGPYTLTVHEGASGGSGGGSDDEQAVTVCSAMNHLIASAEAYVTAIVHRWVLQEAEVLEESAAATLFNHGDDLTRRAALLGDVGRLLAGVSRAFNSVPGGLPAVEALFATARAAVTSAGLRLERGAQLSSTSSLFSVAATAAALTSAGMPAPRDDSVAGVAALSCSALLPELQSCMDVERRLTRLHGWLGLLCTCPTELVADEQFVVAWLYVLMRRVEEMHGYAREGSAQLS
ncbi:hypothetical protein LdCL_140017400 [Leishmania donovani]|uniref:Uncharacterized protein n=1 Tax=Leishmania donovani TaxID=5661 RepID=A0A3S7WT36_LEIDO|nr:hypothetical protein LdCL_140017400 [Leishmania donovani]